MKPSVDVSIAYAADGDDAFHYWALQTGRIGSEEFELRFHSGAVDKLDAAALERRYQVSTVSASAYPRLADDYRILNVGAAVERGPGPALVSRHYHHPAQLQFRRLAVASASSLPGILARWACPDAELVEMAGEGIASAIIEGQADAGVLADGRLPAGSELHQIAGLADLWRRETKLPLPLRLKIVDRRLELEASGRLCDLLRHGLRTALENRAEALLFTASFPGERSDEQLLASALRDGLCLADGVRLALGLLFSLEQSQNLAPSLAELEIIEGNPASIEPAATAEPTI